MIDARLITLVEQTKSLLTRMPDARPSEIMAVKERFGVQFIAMLAEAMADITPEEKIAAFDKLAARHIRELTEAVQRATKGTGFWQDEDEDHYTWESVRQCVLGPKIFGATNALEKLFEPNR